MPAATKPAHTRTMLKWFRQLDNAGSPNEVLTVARDYFATWGPDDLARLPAKCRPGRVRDPQDIADLHACLVEEYRTSAATGDPLKRLQEMTSFTVRAAIRLAELTGEDATPPDSEGAGDGPSRSAAPRDR
jgi:hypothetical protein